MMNLADNKVSSPENEGPVTNMEESKSARRPRLAKTADLIKPTEYVLQLNGEFANWAFDEDRAVAFKGNWRGEVLKTSDTHPLDLEIGTGNGYHFAYLATKNPERALVGIEIKFKPLIQSIRRALRGGAENARIVRYDASLLQNLFAPQELNNVYIHHPDPWPKKRQWKHRLIQAEFFDTLHSLQRPGSFVDFKTDSEEYFDWASERFHQSKFEVVRETRDLHNSDWKDENFVTHFEKLFLAKGQPIFYARLLRN